MSEAAEDEYERGETQWLEDMLEEQWECPRCGALLRGGVKHCPSEAESEEEQSHE